MSSKKIAIVDYGMGNLHSVASALEVVSPDIDVSITGSAAEVDNADHVIFPGVGAIRDCVAEIKRLEFDKVVAKALADGKPVLGICVGMQSLMQFSEENEGVDCLRMLPGNVRFFSGNQTFNRINEQCTEPSQRMKVPHMGWNQVEQKIDHPLWTSIPQSSRFYFVHSYYVEVKQGEANDMDIIAGETTYGIPFTAAIAKGNLFTTQFHPEKSHTHGLQLLKNFVLWDGKTS